MISFLDVEQGCVCCGTTRNKELAQRWANHLVRNRPDVNAQLLEAAKELIEKTNAFLSQWTGMPAPRGYMDLRKEEADLHAAVTQAERGDGVVE